MVASGVGWVVAQQWGDVAVAERMKTMNAG
jgi:hypothetical protein